MTQQNIQTTNTALEQFKRIMLERRGFKPAQQTVAGATVADWRKSVKSLENARKQIEKKPNRDTTNRRRAGERGRMVIEFIQSEKNSGHERPIAADLCARFGIDQSYANELIRREFGKQLVRRKMGQRPTKVKTQTKIDQLCAYLDGITERPQVRVMVKEFHLNSGIVSGIINERFGPATHVISKIARENSARKLEQRREQAREKLIGMESRPLKIRTFARECHISEPVASQLLDERFGARAAHGAVAEWTRAQEALPTPAQVVERWNVCIVYARKLVRDMRKVVQS